MRVFTTCQYEWHEESRTYRLVKSEWYEYHGPVDQLCGASSDQKNIEQQQSQFSQQLTQQATQVFGGASQVFNALMKTFMPTISAGPNQEGFSAAEKANLNSRAVTETGIAYKNAKAAVGNAQASQGGGNTGLVSGAQVGTDLGLAESAANETSNELSTITQENYKVGRENYDKAVAGLEQAPGVFSTATGAANAATSSQEGAANTANEIAQQDNSWVQAVTGALGGIAGGVMTGGMSNLGKGVGFFGGSGSSKG